MGNKYAEPEFSPLIQTIALMVRRARVANSNNNIPQTSLAHSGLSLFDLSQNDENCLYYAEFYEKTLREKHDPQAFGIIFQHFAFDNEHFSYVMATIILRGINRSNYEDAKPYLEAMAYFFGIGDYIQPRRIEWLLGYPQPQVNTLRNEPPSFGMYGNSAIDDTVINYESTLLLESNSSIINLMLHNRRRLENLCLACLKQLLITADMNPAVFEYIYNLPPPSYNYAKFTDWILPFIEYYLAEAKRYSYTTYPKEEAGIECLKIYRSVEEKVDKKLAEQKASFKKYMGIEEANESV
mmetsp:Transcript_29239/g.26656  ORF Transcript_29239/g.26656 Transcript_29239/m.26656 type:complete len:296 (+) Transcript_29239:2057-2944(+)